MRYGDHLALMARKEAADVRPSTSPCADGERAVGECPRPADAYCVRFAIIADGALCSACKSPDQALRAATLQRLCAAALRAGRGRLPCDARSAPIGKRPASGGGRVVAVFVCARHGVKVALTNCALCSERSAARSGS